MRQPGFYKAKYQGIEGLKNTVVEVLKGDKIRAIGLNAVYNEADFSWIDDKPIEFDRPEIFQVKIIACRYTQGWYRNLKGTVLNVKDSGDSYIVTDEAFNFNDSVYRRIHKGDAEILPF